MTGAEVGGLLGFLSSRVLGQYDAFSPDGRLLLIAPNVVSVERELDVDPAEFRLWVCLHEETHRVQFGANPWLAPHLVERIRALIGDLLDRTRGRWPSGWPGRCATCPAWSAARGRASRCWTPCRRRRSVRPSRRSPRSCRCSRGTRTSSWTRSARGWCRRVELIRERFTRRRAGRGAVDRLLRRLLGLEAKMRQYADGARFVREVTARVGVDGFNAVWTGPDTLPRAAEIADPGAWVRRVHP